MNFDMRFESTAPSIVRSVRQRDLLNTWLRLRAAAGATPAMADYHPSRIEDELKDIVYYVVRAQGAGWQFIIDSHGSRLAHAYGKAGTSSVGMDLRDYVGPNMVDVVLPMYEECARRALPTYSISTVEDTEGRRVAYERLLMPFSNGHSVTRVIASLKTISDDGKFEITNLLRNPGKLPEYRLRAVIDRELAIGPAMRESRHLSCDLPASAQGDVIEV
jgi:hypothetical protein